MKNLQEILSILTIINTERQKIACIDNLNSLGNNPNFESDKEIIMNKKGELYKSISESISKIKSLSSYKGFSSDLNQFIQFYNSIKEEISDFGRQILYKKKEKKYSKEDFIKLLKHMNFENISRWGDLVSIGVDGKRPFWNSNVLSDIRSILWKDANWEEEFTDVDYEVIFNWISNVLNDCIQSL